MASDQYTLGAVETLARLLVGREIPGWDHGAVASAIVYAKGATTPGLFAPSQTLHTIVVTFADKSQGRLSFPAAEEG